MDELNEKNLITEEKYFNAKAEKRNDFKKTFMKKATKKPGLILPYKNFDIAKSRNNGLKRLRQTEENILELNGQIKSELSRSNLLSSRYKILHKKNEENLKRIEMIKTSHDIQVSPSIGNKRKFNRINRELYGEIDKNTFNSLLAEKKYIIQNFDPRNDLAIKCKIDLLAQPYLKNVRTKKPNIPTEIMQKIRKILRKEYTCVFELIDKNKTYDAEETKVVFEKIVKKLGINWVIVVSEDVSVVTDSITGHKIKLPVNFSRTGREVQRLAIHEICVHSMRAVNGKKNGGILLEYGTDKYLSAEEGLATLCECSIEDDFDNESFKRISYRYLTAGFAIGADGKKRNAIEVFNTLVPFFLIENAKKGIIDDDTINKALDKAYHHVENAFRGTDWLTKGMSYLKLKIYYEGLLKNIDYFEKNKDNIEEAFEIAMIGKFDHTRISAIKDALLIVKMQGKK